MARVSGFNRVADCGVVWNIDGGLKPGATCTMQNAAGTTVSLRLEAEEFSRLWIDLASDPRFQIDKRVPKRDKNLDDAVDDLLRRTL